MCDLLVVVLTPCKPWEKKKVVVNVCRDFWYLFVKADSRGWGIVVRCFWGIFIIFFHYYCSLLKYLCIFVAIFDISTYMSNTLKLFSFIAVAICLLTSCAHEQKKYVIGVSQCSEDSWRSKLQAELEQSTYFNEDVELIMCSANDNVEEQCRQIDSLVKLNVDLLVVSPQKLEKISGSIAHASEKKIPVILFDRKSDVKDYAAFMGADNYKIGRMLGDFAAAQLGGRGNIVEIAGEHGSSPAMERHRGFADALKNHPEMHIIAYDEGDWKLPSGEEAMERILAKLEKENPNFSIDLVYGGNDRMAVGARHAIEHYTAAHQAIHNLKPSNIIYLGIDALPTPGGGIERVRDGELTASAIYPTHGDVLMELALKILRGEPYEKVNDMETSIVTKDNANVLLLQHKEIQNQDRYIKKMHNRVDSILSVLSIQRFLLLFIILVVLVVSILLVVSVRAYRVKMRLNEQLQKKNDELNKEKETVERQRDLLEEQRDQLLDATTTVEEEDVDTQNPNLYQSPDSEHPRNEFMERFLESLERRYADADLSVEDIGQDLCLSRVQLYRKVKAVTGRTPVEIIREERLKKAHILLEDSSLSVSEVAYKVGFSAPSYFTKCYKEFYGKSPSNKQK